MGKYPAPRVAARTVRHVEHHGSHQQNVEDEERGSQGSRRRQRQPVSQRHHTATLCANRNVLCCVGVSVVGALGHESFAPRVCQQCSLNLLVNAVHISNRCRFQERRLSDCVCYKILQFDNLTCRMRKEYIPPHLLRKGLPCT